jgi:hypothetical protein
MIEPTDNIIDAEDLSSFDDVDYAREQNITPKDRLKFAKTILFFLMIMCCLGAITELLRPGNNVFEACRTILPSMATLVIGYYFGKM